METLHLTYTAQTIIMQKATDIAAYIAAFPPEVQVKLNAVWKTVRQAAPKATEKIAYGMPALALDGPLVYFAAYKNHIGFYPMPSAILEFKNELAAYQCSKGAVQFPLDKPLPLALVKRMTAFRVERNKDKAAAKKQGKSAGTGKPDKPALKAGSSKK